MRKLLGFSRLELTAPLVRALHSLRSFRSYARNPASGQSRPTALGTLFKMSYKNENVPFVKGCGRRSVAARSR
jgi:hypothetical protein